MLIPQLKDGVEKIRVVSLVNWLPGMEMESENYLPQTDTVYRHNGLTTHDTFITG